MLSHVILTNNTAESQIITRDWISLTNQQTKTTALIIHHSITNAIIYLC